MLDRQQAIDLIKKERLQENVIRHTMQVNKVANYLAKELSKRGVGVNTELVDVGSLLHDIGRARDHEKHGEIGYNLLMEMGEQEIARVIKAHILIPEEELTTWEEKVVNYADKRVTHDKIVSLKNRVEDILVRYPSVVKKERKFREPLERWEKEIFEVIGWEKEPLSEVINDDTVH